MRDSERSQRQIEQDNGFTQGYLSQVLQGHIALTVRHLYGVLLALPTSCGRGGAKETEAGGYGPLDR